MKFITESNKASPLNATNNAVVEKIRWSLRQRLRVQLKQLNVEFFDEADDFLFSAGKQGQFDEENPYLRSMRELRMKQGLYEESFLSDVLLRLKQFQGQTSRSEKSLTSAGLGAAFERVEIDLAFRSMSRKAEKLYSPHLRQIDSLNRRHCELPNEELISGSALIHSSLQAFMQAQSCFTLPLDIRLVFIKLFEQHFLLRMEKLFLDIISILNNVSDDKFIQKLVSSSSAFGAKKKFNQVEKAGLESLRVDFGAGSDMAAATVEAAVTDLVSQLCDSCRMPLFIERMLRTHWSAVMRVVGLNAGCKSAQWNEAKCCALMLSADASQRGSISLKEKRSLLDQVEQGFKLVRIKPLLQQEFLVELNQMLGFDHEAITQVSKPSEKIITNQAEEASISPSGRRLLNQDDLNELAKLLGGSEKTQQSSQASPQLDEYFSEVDQLINGQEARFKIEGSYYDCRVIFADTGFYDVQFDDLRPKVRLSKLALAMSLKQRDLMLESLNAAQAISSPTVLNHNLH